MTWIDLVCNLSAQDTYWEATVILTIYAAIVTVSVCVNL